MSIAAEIGIPEDMLPPAVLYVIRFCDLAAELYEKQRVGGL